LDEKLGGISRFSSIDQALGTLDQPAEAGALPKPVSSD
jgi:hypothetical protein